MFAYCENNPVDRIDPSGEFFFTMLGGVTGFIGSAVTSLILGNDIADAIEDGLAGAVGGAIAGFGVDAGLLLIGTGGVAASFLAAGLAFGFGGAVVLPQHQSHQREAQVVKSTEQHSLLAVFIICFRLQQVGVVQERPRRSSQ